MKRLEIWLVGFALFILVILLWFRFSADFQPQTVNWFSDQIPQMKGQFGGSLDVYERGILFGWACNGESAGPTSVRIYIEKDGHVEYEKIIETSSPRLDVVRAKRCIFPNSGYSADLNAAPLKLKGERIKVEILPNKFPIPNQKFTF